jgi:hypothetical protein
VAFMYKDQLGRTEIYEYALIESMKKDEDLEVRESSRIQITGMREIYASSKQEEKF